MHLLVGGSIIVVGSCLGHKGPLNVIYICLHLLVAFGGQKLPAEYAQRPIDEDSCLAVLLPSLRDYGLCSIALLFFLHKKQNDFLEEYSKLKKQTLV